MKTHNASIYHCISCGRVEHAESEAEPPQCCRHSMTKACPETILEGDVAGETTSGHSETTTQVIDDRKKPR